VPRNEDGEFELVLGNRQLLSVFFLVAVLLGLSFVMGYVFGRSAAPVLSAESAPPASAPAAPQRAEPAQSPPSNLDPPAPVQTAPQLPAETARPAPPPAPKEAARVPAGSQPVPGRIYLQLSATSRDQAEAMVDLLRARSFTAMAAQIPENPQLFRVLVGPIENGGESRVRAELKAASFPGDEAIRKVF
jgi:cell division septation protein DedD